MWRLLSIYGGTFNLIDVTMRKMGVEVTFVSPDCTTEELNAAFRDNTRAVFGETIANPALTVLDIEKFAAAAHAHGVPLIVDNTLPPRSTAAPLTGVQILNPFYNEVYGCTALLWVVPLWTADALTGWLCRQISRLVHAG